MILPNKVIKPNESLLYLSSRILPKVTPIGISFDELYDSVNLSLTPRIGVEKFILCLNFLYIIGKLEVQNEIVKVKL